MRYPLHTTNNLESLPALLQQKGRYAVWVHVASDEDRLWAQHQIISAHPSWKLVDGLPLFFVVGVHPSVTTKEIDRLRDCIQPSKDEEKILFLAAMFGYARWEIEWYLWAVGLRDSWSGRSTAPLERGEVTT